MADTVAFDAAFQDATQLGLGFDVDTMIDDTLTNTCIYNDDEMPSFCNVFDEGNIEFSDVQVCKSKTSPFHESDSGVSEMTGLSPSHEMLDEMLDNMDCDPFLMISAGTQQDEDLINYLTNDENQEPAVVSNGHQTRSKSGVLKNANQGTIDSVENVQGKAGASSRVLRSGAKSLLPKKSSISSQVYEVESEDDDIDIELSDNEKNTSKKPRGSVKINRPGSTLPKRARSSDSESSSCNVTSVKVIRIKNSGIGSDAADEVTRALEERNRKNAEMAKVNRQKKKAYIESLEKEVEDSKKRADVLETRVGKLEEEREDLEHQVEYLKSVLANQSALAGLLKNIPCADGVSLSSSSSRKRTAEMDHSYTPKRSRTTTPSSTAGVCLHVDQGNVSLEFCHHCARMAGNGKS